MAKEKLTIEHVSDAMQREGAVVALARDIEPVSVSHGLCSVRSYVRDADIFEVREGGRFAGYYAIEAREHDQGVEGIVLAGGGSSSRRGLGAFLLRRVLPLIERQFVAVDCITVVTMRPGMVRELERQGYGVEGYICRKRLHREVKC